MKRDDLIVSVALAFSVVAFIVNIVGALMTP